MKQIKKELLLGAGSCVIIGLMLCLFASFLIGFDFRKLNTEPRLAEKTKSVEMIQENQTVISNIEMNIKNFDIEIEAIKGNEAKIYYMENEKEGFQIKVLSDTLKIDYQNKHKWTDYIINLNFLPQKRKIVLELPEQFTGSLLLKNADGTIQINDLKHLQEARIQTKNERISLHNIIIQDSLYVRNSNGKINLELVNAGSIDAQTSNELFQGTEIESETALFVLNKSGELILKECKAKEISAETKNEAIRMENIQAEGIIQLNNKNGSIKLKELHGKEIEAVTKNEQIQVEKIDADIIRLFNKNESISGSIVGKQADYQINCTANNGKSNLSEQKDGRRKLKAETKNDDIKLIFTED